MNRNRQFVLALSAALAATSGAYSQTATDTGTQQASPLPATPAAADKTKPAKPPTARQRSKAEHLYLEGAKALERKDLTTAEEDFQEAAELVPGNEQYQAANEIAHQHRATELVQAADKARILGKFDESEADLIQAFHLDPKNPMVAQHLDEIAHVSAPVPAERYTEDADTAGAPIQLAPAKTRHSFHIHSGASDVLKQVLSAYGMSATIDSSVKSQTVRLDADDVNFDEAARMVKLITNTFFVPLDPSRILVAEDTKDNRTKFERLSLETVYLPGLTPAEMTDMGNLARNLFEAQQATISPSNSSLIVRAPAAKMAALNSTLSEMLTGHSEVQVDVRLYSIAKTRSLNIGLQLPQQSTIFNVPSELNSILQNNQSLVQQIISSGLASAGDDAAIAAILIASGAITGSILNQPFAIFGGGVSLTGLTVTGITGNLALNSSDTRALDNVTLHVQDQEESTIRSGTRYPIITSSYSSLSGSTVGIPGISSAGISSALAGLGISASSIANSGQTIPQVQYQDLGLTLKVKPYIQKDRDVTLNLDFKIVSLQGTLINAIPVLDNQDFNAIITLHEGASALLVSALSKQQTGAVNGIPGLSELPGFQSTTNNQTENDVSNLLVLITPHVVRVAHRQDAGNMFVLPVHP
jgi:general secretion pathway protein D